MPKIVHLQIPIKSTILQKNNKIFYILQINFTKNSTSTVLPIF